MITAWCPHLQSLAVSKAGKLPELRDMANEIDRLAIRAIENEELSLRIKFCVLQRS